jgi:DNA-binding XRE family transcriptional regulator
MLYYQKLLTEFVEENSIGIAAQKLNCTKNSIHQWTKYNVEPRLEALAEMARFFRVPRPLLVLDIDNLAEIRLVEKEIKKFLPRIH